MTAETAPPAAPAKCASRDFADWCAEELRRRANADAAFDAPLHDEAVELVLRKLRRREGELAP